MLSARFNERFRILVARWIEWRDAPRDPERVPELATARFALEDARSAVAVERERIVSPPRNDRRTSISDDDLARLRVFGAGSQQS